MENKKGRVPIIPWLSARYDHAEKRFIQVGNTLIMSKEWQELSAGARLLYLSMAMEAAGLQQFVFPLAVAKKHGFCAGSFRRYIPELIEHGFIELVKSGKETRTKNVYCFAFGWKKKPDNIYSDYIESEEWKAVRRKRMSIDGYQCQMCGTAKNLEVHHLTYERLGHEDMDDLITLCHKCHEKVHKNDLEKRG